MTDGELQRSGQIARLAVELVQALRLVCPAQSRHGPFNQAQEERGVSPLRSVTLVARLQLLEGVAADRVQHPKSTRLDGGRRAVDQAVLEQPADGFQDLVRIDVVRGSTSRADGCDGLQGKSVREHG